MFRLKRFSTYNTKKTKKKFLVIWLSPIFFFLIFAQNVPKLKFYYELVFSVAFLSMMVSDEEQPIIENLCFFCSEVPVLPGWLVFIQYHDIPKCRTKHEFIVKFLFGDI